MLEIPKVHPIICIPCANDETVSVEETSQGPGTAGGYKSSVHLYLCLFCVFLHVFLRWAPTALIILELTDVNEQFSLFPIIVLWIRTFFFWCVYQLVTKWLGILDKMSFGLFICVCMVFIFMKTHTVKELHRANDGDRNYRKLFDPSASHTHTKKPTFFCGWQFDWYPLSNFPCFSLPIFGDTW